ncbi:Defensin-like (DEFL) family protein [Arabidopsis thaliana]|uniref:Putative defensin-like protein 305 n=1 Tax=Arabidopsis thaliana TaxID=3702 RepID=DF305_ARATH|nr:Defensin-like (DEFL) family protein [Arabidopsis thaliana]Q2V493.1 RecName: Full=Putative defensin-like protein 305; Flags: Precursor [Arabidopsis thaliana]AEC06003.1 Defensin-like (DEFL) family protein [Arabidopsis thaliana]|eukprot:NP_001031341.1 Defensin-like (DEFL) family protein [Arabidopsis thaliana]
MREEILEIFLLVNFVFILCTSIMVRIRYVSCKTNFDCVNLKCPTPFVTPKCVSGGCECPLKELLTLLSDTNYGVAACIDYCKAKGENAYTCILNHCYCRKPSM